MTGRRILLFDLEVAHSIVASYIPVWRQTGSHKSVLEDSYIMAAAWKWLGTEKIESRAVKPGKCPSDKALVKELLKVIYEADAIVAHNGDRYDRKILNARLLVHGLGPLPRVISIDTCKIAKQALLLHSNSLEWLGKILGSGQKNSPDMSVWLDALKGDAEALKKIAKYNVEDIVLLEDIFIKLAPFIPSGLNRAMGVDIDEPICPCCGSEWCHKRGSYHTRTTTKQRFQCTECLHSFSATKSVATAKYS